MSVTNLRFREALSALPAGVTIITSQDRDGAPVGATVSAFCSLSLDPPMILASLDANSRTASAIRDCGAFAVHIVRSGDEAMALHFASRVPDKFVGLRSHRNAQGVPVLEDCPLRLDCELSDIHPGGDHIIIVGGIVDIAIADDLSDPVVWHDRGFRRLAEERFPVESFDGGFDYMLQTEGFNFLIA